MSPSYHPSALVIQLHQVFRHDTTANTMWTKWHGGDFPSWEAFLMSLVCVLAAEKEGLTHEVARLEMGLERSLTGHQGTTPPPELLSKPLSLETWLKHKARSLPDPRPVLCVSVWTALGVGEDAQWKLVWHRAGTKPTSPPTMPPSASVFEAVTVAWGEYFKAHLGTHIPTLWDQALDLWAASNAITTTTSPDHHFVTPHGWVNPLKTSSNPMDHSSTYNPPNTPTTSTWITEDPNPIPPHARPSHHIRRSFLGRAEEHP